jgi:hypothetical protein
MKDIFAFLKEARLAIGERLEILDNPNAYTPPSERYTPTAADQAFDRLQQKKYGAVMARVAAKAFANAQKRSASSATRRNPFPWSDKGYSMKAGWWHPTKQWFTFSHSSDGYHVTQIVKSPAKFGVSNTELERALQAEANRRNENNLPHYGKDGTEHPWAGADIKAAILKEEIDLAYEVQRVAYMKGWLKVYSGTGTSSPSLEGINGDSIRAALREISEIPGDFKIVVVDRVGLKAGQSQFNRYNPKEWRTAS